MTRDLHRAARRVYFSEEVRAPDTQEELERGFFGTLRLRNGVYKYTYSRRLDDLNALVAEHLPPARPLHLMDVAVSSGVSTLEWSRSLDSLGIEHTMTASDIDVGALLYSFGASLHVLTDRSGWPLQYEVMGRAIPTPVPRRKLPLYLPVIGLFRVLLRRARAERLHAEVEAGGRAVSRGRVICRPVTLVSPRLLQDGRIEVVEDDITTNDTIRERFHVVRAANILNRDYFDDATIARTVANLRGRLLRGGILIVCTSTGDIGEDSAPVTNDGTVFTLNHQGRFEAVGRIGVGSAVEDFVLAAGAEASGTVTRRPPVGPVSPAARSDRPTGAG